MNFAGARIRADIFGLQIVAEEIDLFAIGGRKKDRNGQGIGGKANGQVLTAEETVRFTDNPKTAGRFLTAADKEEVFSVSGPLPAAESLRSSPIRKNPMEICSIRADFPDMPGSGGRVEPMKPEASAIRRPSETPF